MADKLGTIERALKELWENYRVNVDVVYLTEAGGLMLVRKAYGWDRNKWRRYLTFMKRMGGTLRVNRVLLREFAKAERRNRRRKRG